MPDLFVQDLNPSSGRAVVLLHGLGTTGDCWQLQTPVLTAAGFRVLIPDLPGFGRTGYPGGPLTIAGFATDMRRAMALREVSRADVVGISMGGTVALQLVLDAPELVDHLVLINTFSHLRITRASGWLALAVRIALLYGTSLPAQARAVSRRIFPHPGQEALRQALYDQLVQSDPSAYRAAIWALQRFNVTARLGEIVSPTLIITGDEDKTVSLDSQRALLAIPGSRQVVIAGAGHGVIADHPGQSNAALLGFLMEH